MKKILLLTLCIVFWAPAFACTWKSIDDLEKAQKSGFKQYDLIFIGKVIAINAEIKIHELHQQALVELQNEMEQLREWK